MLKSYEKKIKKFKTQFFGREVTFFFKTNTFMLQLAGLRAMPGAQKPGGMGFGHVKIFHEKLW